MTSRIRYDFDQHIGVSRSTYGTRSGENVRIVVDTQGFKFEIVNTRNEVIVAGGNTKNYIVLLRQAKRALIALGCMFENEERNRNYGIVKKSS